jgi:CHAT domain-containing protein
MNGIGGNRLGLASRVAALMLAVAGPVAPAVLDGAAAAQPAAAAPDEASVRAATFIAAQGVIVSAADDGLSNNALRLAEAKNPKSALARERAGLIYRIRAIRRQIETVFNGRDPDRNSRLRTLMDEVRTLESALVDVDRRTSSEFSAFAALSRPRPLSAREVQGLLRPDEALLVIVPGSDAVYTWVVTRERFEWARSEMTADQVADSVRTLRAHLDVGTSGEPLKPFRRAVAHDLYLRLVAPLEPVFRAKRVLLSATAGPLQSLPLGVLVTDPPAGHDESPEDAASTRWLIDRYALATLPAVSSLLTLRCFNGAAAARPVSCPAADPRSPPAADRAAARPNSFAGFGDPLVHGSGPAFQGPGPASQYSRGEVADVRALDGLARLRQTADVVRKVAAEFGDASSLVRVGPQMTEPEFKSNRDVASAEYILIATHGLLSTQAGAIGEPGLVFTPPSPDSSHEELLRNDGLLTASEVATLDLSAQFVVLSACNTARSDGVLGSDGLAGLARAFFFAGARSLLVSHWPVDADASEALVIETFRIYRGGPLPAGMPQSMTGPPGPRTKAEALQASIYSVRHDRDHPHRALPVFWGAFVLVGD